MAQGGLGRTVLMVLSLCFKQGNMKNNIVIYLK